LLNKTKKQDQEQQRGNKMSGAIETLGAKTPRYMTVMMMMIATFSISLVTMNFWVLPSAGFLNGSVMSHQKSMEEFVNGRKTTKMGAMNDKSLGGSSSNLRGKEGERQDNANHPNLEIHDLDGKIPSDSDEEKPKVTSNEKPKEKPKGETKTKDDSTEQQQQQQQQQNDDSSYKIAGLNCDRFGGPSEEVASEMVYWRDIPSDAKYFSPYHNKNDKEKKYLTFEPDEGGFNNIRMSMETATALAHAMGRILVLPPEQKMYLLDKDGDHKHNRFTFHSFFPYEALAEEHHAVDVISMEEFLKTEAMTGNLKDANGIARFPPMNQTFGGKGGSFRHNPRFWTYLRETTVPSKFSFSECVVVFPEKPGSESVKEMQAIYDKMDMKKQTHNTWKRFKNNPRMVNSNVETRLSEMLSFRRKICMYNETYQDAKVMHFMGDNNSGARLLVHFYAFLFFQDWKQDLWTKRYVRDHLRYIDEIQCAAARIVAAMKEKARENGNTDGNYHSMHIRRGDFQYKETRIPATEIYDNIKEIFEDNSTLFIATDERNKTFFDPLAQHYQIYFLDNFVHLLPKDFNKNYYGMLDQRIASRGLKFAGAYYSTFTGYINRMRGYHSQKEKLDGYLDGKLESYFYVPREKRDDISVYSSLLGPLWGREFPTAWRDIDHDLEDHHIVSR